MKVILSSKKMHLDFYNGIVSTDDVLDLLQMVGESLYSNKNNLEEQMLVLEEFKDASSKLQIVISNEEDISRWMQIPLVLSETKYKLSFAERTKALLENKVLLNGDAYERSANIISNITYPIKIRLDKEKFNISESEEINKLYSMVLYLAYKIEFMLDSYELEHIGIFQSPHAVIAINSLEGWLKREAPDFLLNRDQFIDSLEVIKFEEIFKTSEVLQNSEENQHLEFLKFTDEGGVLYQA